MGRSGTSRTQGGSEQRVVKRALDDRRRWKVPTWAQLRHKLDIEVDPKVVEACVRNLARTGVVQLEILPDKGIRVFTDCR